jgi:hypothetical protein
MGEISWRWIGAWIAVDAGTRPKARANVEKRTSRRAETGKLATNSANSVELSGIDTTIYCLFDRTEVGGKQEEKVRITMTGYSGRLRAMIVSASKGAPTPSYCYNAI